MLVTQPGAGPAKGGSRLGMAIEACVSLAAAIAVVVFARRAGLGLETLAICLAAASPLVGEFSMTMAYRYRPGMGVAEAASRLLRPSSCDSCSRVLSQWDILPVVPYVVRGGRCSCRAFKVPADCTLVGLTALSLAVATLIAVRIQGAPLAAACVPLALVMAYMPAMVADVVHGECDEAVALLPIPLLLALHPYGMGMALACGLGSALLVVGSALFAALIRRSLSPFPLGTVDVAIAFGAGCVLDVPRLVSANVFLLPAAALSYVAVRWAGRRVAGRYGPDGEEGATAFPMVPAIVMSSWAGSLWVVADSQLPATLGLR